MGVGAVDDSGGGVQCVEEVAADIGGAVPCIEGAALAGGYFYQQPRPGRRKSVELAPCNVDYETR